MSTEPATTPDLKAELARIWHEGLNGRDVKESLAKATYAAALKGDADALKLINDAVAAQRRTGKAVKHKWPKGLKARQRAFLDAFVHHQSILAACQATKVGRTTVYDWRRKDHLFREAESLASEMIKEDLEAAAYEWANPQRTEKPNAGLLKFLLQARAPQTYQPMLHYRLKEKGATDEQETHRKIIVLDGADPALLPGPDPIHSAPSDAARAETGRPEVQTAPEAEAGGEMDR